MCSPEQEVLSASSRVAENLAKLDCWRTSTILDMLKLQLLKTVLTSASISPKMGSLWYIPLALCMKIDTANRPLHLVETNVVKSLKAGARNRPHPMIRDEKILLPTHEHVLTLRKIAVSEIGSLGLLG